MAARWPGILSSAAFTASYSPPDYVVDRILQQGYLYSVTGTTGAGKTAVTLRLAAHVALGLPFGDAEVASGRVLFLAGENPTDIQMRWAALARNMSFDLSAVTCDFVAGTYGVKKFMPKVEEYAAAVGGIRLVVVDTAIAYFGGDNENDNVQMSEYARVLRSFTELAGKPCVLVNCHPTKRGNITIPRGGGAFLNEVDGNLTVSKGFGDDVVHIGWAEKWRGPAFDPIMAELLKVEGPMQDSKGRPMPTMLARPLADMASEALRKAAQRQEQELLWACLEMPESSRRALCEALGWVLASGEPDTSRVGAALARLEARGLLKLRPDKTWEITPAGLKAQQNQDAKSRKARLES